jgi:protein TonB
MFELRHPIASGNADALRLGAACILSLLFHAAVLGGADLFHVRTQPAAATPEPLQATIAAPELPPPRKLIAPKAPPAAAKPEPKPDPKPRPAPPRGFTAIDAARMALQQMAKQPFYPEEAIARGIEGKAVVRLFLDESGNAIAARLEASSGHAILDEAAVRAARAVRSLPAGTPSEIILPVRFRLR